MTDLLVVEGLVKSFGGFLAINKVDLKIQTGLLTSIIGPNGAGKTTLINLITGNLEVDGGRILLAGKDVTRRPVHDRVRIGMTRSFQISNLFLQLTVYRNIQLPVLARRGRADHFFANVDLFSDIHDEVGDILRTIGLWEKRNQIVGALSHGDQRLLEIGMAIAPKPKLCFLDEPCAGMNPVERVQVLDLILRLARDQGLTFVVVEHDMDIVFSLSDRIVVMNKGEILADGSPEMIRNHEGVREIYLGEEVNG